MSLRLAQGLYITKSQALEDLASTGEDLAGETVGGKLDLFETDIEGLKP